MALNFASIPDFLAAIRDKPGMYIGARSITRLELTLIGFRFAEELYGIPENQKLGGFDFNAFENDVARKYNPERLSVLSYYLAREAAGNEEAGFLLWFQWYDEFRRAFA